MTEEFHLLIAALVGVLVAIAFGRVRSELRRKAWRARNRQQWEPRRGGTGVARETWPSLQDPFGPKQPDTADQLRIVMGASFTVRSVLNISEARVFKELDRMVISHNPGWQVMAQVSLGEILRCKDAEAYACINSKRVDLLLMDETCRPRHAIEYQGKGHHQGSAAARDAVKKEALRQAGIGYHEVVAGHTTPSELRRLVEKIVDRPKELR